MQKPLNIVIPGGTGQIGTILARAFHADGHNVVVLSRRPQPAVWTVKAWNSEVLGDWTADIEAADVVINLAGHTVNCRYTAENRQLILKSRINSTQMIGKAISAAKSPPRLWLQASAATSYSDEGLDQKLPNDIRREMPDAADNPFIVDVAKTWERTLDLADVPQTRKVKLRTSLVMSPDQGGVFSILLKLVRLGLGGRAGTGRQSISWIHYLDYIRAIYWLIDHEIEGAVNLTAPNPLPNDEFMRVLRQAAGIRVGLPATETMIRLGATIIRTESELILGSRRFVPTRLLESGFAFQFPTWPDAARILVRK